MSYESLESRLKLLPEECLDEVSKYVDFIFFRLGKEKGKTENNDLSHFFGSVKNLPDGLELQRSLRNG